jgi:phosphoglycolate phosphatase
MTTKPKLLVFDLDGTLADTRMDIAQAVNVALVQSHLPPLPCSLIITFVGHGAHHLLQRCFAYHNSQDEQMLHQAVEIFRTYYEEHVSDYTRLYPGVAETLDRLPGIKAVLTNKLGNMSQRLIKALGITTHFAEIIGGDVDANLKPNPHGLLYLMRNYQASRDETWMIGDSPIDIQVARNAGCTSLAVSYGFTCEEELCKHRPDYLLRHFREIWQLWRAVEKK